MLPSAILSLGSGYSLKILDLQSSWQIPSVLLSALICGPQSALIATIAYLTIGLVYLPVFQGGGSIGYMASPAFGYLVGFVPAVWITGNWAKVETKKSIFNFFTIACTGLVLIHTIGIINIIIGTITLRWDNSILDLLIKYSITTFPIQLLLCAPTILLAKTFRRALLIR
ncbi:biotin transporter BioY [Prochlorococcus sp. MIT 0602]|uniref:biotin transporter BioY n=2 Tax=Prochlorococcus TaxID=1218 RepID=UPI0009DE0930|nr:biotin transporter BioY [Prochlorococcus sp. MIT 0602]